MAITYTILSEVWEGIHDERDRMIASRDLYKHHCENLAHTLENIEPDCIASIKSQKAIDLEVLGEIDIALTAYRKAVSDE